jgi:hypothetical protein
MRFSVFGFAYLVLAGCSGQNIVAGSDQTESEQLAASVSSFCASLCPRLRACPADECTCDGDVCDCRRGADYGCEGDCADFFEPYVGTGDACAVVGKRLKSCLNGLSCDDLSSKNACRPTDAEEALCPTRADETSEPPTYVGPTTSTGTAGGPSAGDGGTDSYGGSTVGPAVVRCTDGQGGGAAPPVTGSVVVCESQYSNCDDSHVYSWICAQDSDGRRGCTCFQDQTVVGAFAPGESCPGLAEANAGCHWALIQ